MAAQLNLASGIKVKVHVRSGGDVTVGQFGCFYEPLNRILWQHASLWEWQGIPHASMAHFNGKLGKVCIHFDGSGCPTRYDWYVLNVRSDLHSTSPDRTQLGSFVVCVRLQITSYQVLANAYVVTFDDGSSQALPRANLQVCIPQVFKFWFSKSVIHLFGVAVVDVLVVVVVVVVVVKVVNE